MIAVAFGAGVLAPAPAASAAIPSMAAEIVSLFIVFLYELK
jgi:hypothetical protein